MNPSQDQAAMVSVIIISYNTREMLVDCLRSLYGRVDGIAVEVLIVDNASSDGSVEAVRREFPAAEVIVNTTNVGFGAANNQAMARARGKFFLLLNSDAFPRPGAVSALARLLDEHPEAGVVGPRLVNPDGSLQNSCFRFTTPLRAWLENLWITKLLPIDSAHADYYGWDHASVRNVDFVIGACLLVRREVFEQVGGFDERFFMYQEEADWQKRIHEAGWQVVFTPTAEAMHIAGASGKEEPIKINNHFFESLDKYLLKHHGWTGFLLVRVAMLVGCSLRSVGWTLAACSPRLRPRASRRARQLAWLFARQLVTAPPAKRV